MTMHSRIDSLIERLYIKQTYISQLDVSMINRQLIKLEKVNATWEVMM